MSYLVLFSTPSLPPSDAVCMQPGSGRRIKLDLIFNSMEGSGFGVYKGFVMQTHLFLWNKKMGFSKYGMFWKVGSGFETLVSLMAPLNEKNGTKT